MHTVLIHCNASTEIGFGHLFRCLALADALRRNQLLSVAFAMAESPAGFERIREQGFPLFTWSSDRGMTREEWLQETLQQSGSRILLLDLRDPLHPDFIRQCRSRGLVLAGLDDLTATRCLMDLLFSPPLFDPEELSWEGFTGTHYHGWEWVVLRPEFRPPAPRPENRPPRILVTMGGSDPAGLTEQAVQALCLAGGGFQADIVLGPGFPREGKVRELLQEACFLYQLHRNATDMATRMASADMAVASFGMTAYELAAMGVPALYLCLTPVHHTRARGFAAQGLARNLGLYNRVIPEEFAMEIHQLAVSRDRRLSMKQAAQQKELGSGADRVAARIADALRAGRQ